MGERDLAGVRSVPAANQPGMRDGVVWRAEWAVAQQRGIGRQLIRHRIDAGHIQRLVDRHFGQYARQGACQQGFARPGRSHH